MLGRAVYPRKKSRTLSRLCVRRACGRAGGWDHLLGLIPRPSVVPNAPILNCPRGFLRPITVCAINVPKPSVSSTVFATALVHIGRGRRRSTQWLRCGPLYGAAAAAGPGLGGHCCWCVARGTVSLLREKEEDGDESWKGRRGTCRQCSR